MTYVTGQFFPYILGGGGGGTEPKNAISQDGRSKTCGWIALKFDVSYDESFKNKVAAAALLKKLTWWW